MKWDGSHHFFSPFVQDHSFNIYWNSCSALIVTGIKMIDEVLQKILMKKLPIKSKACQFRFLLQSFFLSILYSLITRTLFLSRNPLKCSLCYQCLAYGNSRTLDGSGEAQSDDADGKKPPFLLRSSPEASNLDQNKLLIKFWVDTITVMKK